MLFRKTKSNIVTNIYCKKSPEFPVNPMEEFNFATSNKNANFRPPVIISFTPANVTCLIVANQLLKKKEIILALFNVDKIMAMTAAEKTITLPLPHFHFLSQTSQTLDENCLPSNSLLTNDNKNGENRTAAKKPKKLKKFKHLKGKRNKKKPGCACKQKAEEE